MKILLITDKFVPERGGSQIIFGQTYRNLPGHEVTVLTRAWPGAEAADAAYPHRIVRVPYSRVPRLRSPLLWARLARSARDLCRAEGFDQIHCGQTVETGPAGTLLAQRLARPSLVHTFAEDVTTWMRHPLYTPMMRGALRRATLVTSICRYTLDYLAQLGVQRNRVRLQYPGVNPDEWRPTGGQAEIRRRFGLEGKRVLVTVSRLIPRKGQDVVLQSLPQVLSAAPDAVYLIVGGGPEEARLRRLAEDLGVSKHVRWAGSIPHAAAVDYYHAADLFVMPNRRMPNGDIEGFGLVFLEANACGLPVIGGRSGGAVDAIAHGESGYLVEPTVVDDVATRLIELLRNREQAREMGRQGEARVRREFTWEHSGAALAATIEAAAAATRQEISARG